MAGPSEFIPGAARMPQLSSAVELFARAGILWYDLEIDRNDTAVVDNSDRDPVLGAGLGFTVAKRLNLRAEYEVVEIDGLDDSNAVWLTAAWRF